MLRSGLANYASQPGKSIRKLGTQLGYKQAAILSHMASGRVPIPLDRAVDLAAALDLDVTTFVASVLKQRHPEAYEVLARAPSEDRFAFVHSANALDLTPAHDRVIREVMRDARPQERWMTIPELETMERIRATQPKISTYGLSQEELQALERALHNAKKMHVE